MRSWKASGLASGLGNSHIGTTGAHKFPIGHALDERLVASHLDSRQQLLVARPAVARLGHKFSDGNIARHAVLVRHLWQVRGRVVPTVVRVCEVNEHSVQTNLPIVDVATSFKLVQDGELASQRGHLVQANWRKTSVLKRTPQGIFREPRRKAHGLKAAYAAAELQISCVLHSTSPPRHPGNEEGGLEEGVGRRRKGRRRPAAKVGKQHLEAETAKLAGDLPAGRK